MTSWHGNIFHTPGPLCGESTLASTVKFDVSLVFFALKSWWTHNLVAGDFKHINGDVTKLKRLRMWSMYWWHLDSEPERIYKYPWATCPSTLHSYLYRFTHFHSEWIHFDKYQCQNIGTRSQNMLRACDINRWTLEDLDAILQTQFSIWFYWLVIWVLLMKLQLYPQTNATGPYR